MTTAASVAALYPDVQILSGETNTIITYRKQKYEHFVGESSS